MSESKFQKTWYTIPYHIRKMPGMTLALLDFYETIYEFWNNGEKCYLSNPMIKKRTGIKSSSTIQEAFEYFEKHGAMKRVWKNGKRFIEKTFSLQCDEDETSTIVDNSKKESLKIEQPLAVPRGTSRCTERVPLAVPRHNNNNLKYNNLKKEREDLSVNEKPKKKKKTYVPGDGWIPDELRMEKAKTVSEKFNISVDELIYKFKNWYKARGVTSFDWQAEFGIFLTREKPSNSINSTIKGNFAINESKSTVPWFNDNH